MSQDSTLPRVVVINDVPPSYYEAEPHTLEPLQGRAAVTIKQAEATSADELADWLADAWAVIDIRARSTFDSAMLARLPKLRVIVVRGTTAPLIDVEQATRRGVLVCNTPYQSTAAVSEFSLALMMDAARRVTKMDRALRAGIWNSNDNKGFIIAGKTLGVVGLGMIGQAMCRLGVALGMTVLSWTPSMDLSRAEACGSTLVSLDTLMSTSDVVSIQLRLSDRTRGVIGRRELALMKDGAVFVNTARGKLVDEAALIDELVSGRIVGALDVFEEEPISPDHPLLGLDNVVLTPHAGWATNEVREDRARVPVENVLAALSGTPQNVMNPSALEHANWRAGAPT